MAEDLAVLTTHDYEQAKVYNPLAGRFLRHLRSMLLNDGVVRGGLSIWVRLETVMDDEDEYARPVRSEMYLTRSVYEKLWVRALYLPMRMFGVEAPYIARTFRKHGVVQRIEIGDRRALKTAIDLMEMMRVICPEASGLHLTASDNPLVDLAANGRR